MSINKYLFNVYLSELAIDLSTPIRNAPAVGQLFAFGPVRISNAK